MSKYTPTKKLASTSRVMTTPWNTMSTAIPPANTPSVALRGLRFMMSPSGVLHTERERREAVRDEVDPQQLDRLGRS